MTAPNNGGSIFSHAVVIGVGLIGGSIVRCLRREGLVQRISGVGRETANLERAEQLGIIDDWSHDLAATVASADLIILAVPMGAYAQIFSILNVALPAHAIITDAGSTKSHAIAMAEIHLPNHIDRFVPAHPIAGTEQSGVEASFDSLFQGRRCIITPHAKMSDDALSRVYQIWQATGSVLIEMSAEHHDTLLASVSHLPHLAAFALVNGVCETGKQQPYDPFEFAAGGFRDFTRIASSSPAMWRDIALSNRQALLQTLDGYQQQLTRIRNAIEHEDGDALLGMFTSAKEARDQWLKTYGEKQ
ncbi:MAG: prephenate dehydrogenase/arogenate dehydrogenase family protein [Zetaproteobacteria bacterium]|nr:prephenate dehydrogenase/arogenate dehydrogenase family protein [Zetaproteobacteria bacterium]